MLEPRRVAAKSAARRMAALLGEPVGRTVGYSVRLESRVRQAGRLCGGAVRHARLTGAVLLVHCPAHLTALSGQRSNAHPGCD